MRFSSVRRMARPASTFPTVRDISIVGEGDWVRGDRLIGAVVGSCYRGLFGVLLRHQPQCLVGVACGVNRRITSHHS